MEFNRQRMHGTVAKRGAGVAWGDRPSRRSMLLQGRNNGLRALPLPDAIVGDPWRLITTKELASALNVDPACINTWVYRGIGPPQEPVFFRGSVRTFRVDRVQAWLAQRQSLNYDADATWRAAIGRLVHEPGHDIGQAVRQWIEWLGPEGSAADRCEWLPGGFVRYLDSLMP